LNAFVLETADRAREMARTSDARLAKGEGVALEGLPLGIKDLFCTKDVRTTASSHILENFVPPYESTVTANLWRDGAVMLGKLNNDEFAMGSSNETSVFGPTISPWRRKGANTPLVPGGSSGGSAAAVAAGLCLGATGTDTGGSIRQPAAFTGIVGIKPTYGRCSRWGIVAYASSLDQAGPLARTVRDAAILLTSMAGHDPKDTTSVDRPVPDYEAAIGKSIKGMRIGIPKEYRVEGMTDEIDKLWEQVRNGSRPPAPRSWRCRCRTPNMRCRLTTSWPRRKPRPISRATMACATVYAFLAATSPTCIRTRGSAVSATRCAGAS
jgi:aspartyl-tRNA(Asn)/glutamyl-tRNA(Gln) amidotransferase subunit A